MTRAAFRQADIERIIKAADRQGAAVQIDIRSLVVTVIPGIHKQDAVDGAPKTAGMLPSGNLAPDGEENWDED
ncbi:MULTISPECIES: hypothetical protein [unclassified Rhizobium]|uniref:hypothetical protein n=1 Tax=unclassified Rhizobium TaxID=2613769 RepID=UPI000645AB00|nr:MULTISPECIES: hypothetical protein [unclassified Rhizobium]MBN8950872.1 hypothetical protein [Rhizobium tropici]OJY66389.1 MAG: hypothetical protein BGP09_31150 [Rhizobium sp. 60-20]RKD69026.1 hypothetical protein BJ928_104164 [Rhizobium sp. WW_1]